MNYFTLGLRKNYFFYLLLLAQLVQMAAPRFVAAEIATSSVAIVVNKNVPEGVELAKYYMKKRNIPAQNLYLLDLPQEESIERAVYEAKIVQPLRAQLEKRKASQQIKLLVLMYGVPLKVGAPERTAEEESALKEVMGAREQALKAIQEVAKESERVRALLTDSEQAKLEDLEGEIADDVLLARTHNYIRKAAQAIVETDGGTEKNKQAKETMNRLISGFGGLAAISQSIKVAPGQENKEAEAAIVKIKTEVDRARQLIGFLDETKTLENRRRALAITAKIFGASGIVLRAGLLGRWLSYSQADASVDSELSFLWWDTGMYLVSERMPNPFYHALQKQTENKFHLPLMMVGRLDGPKPELVRGMIDRAVEVEAAGQGIAGDIFVDARGLESATDGYGLYDQNLRDFAWLVRENSDLSVKLDNNDTRWSEPGDAENVALYSGWYRLRQYEPAFKFSPGAVGYHIASEEAVSLRDPDEQGWCKRAIEEGITVTLGPVSEPYVDAFPLPLEFFGVLLSGEFSVVETYYLTNPYLSWRMVLVGDPMYSPYRNAGKLNFGALATKSERAKTLTPKPTSPIEMPFPDPLAARKAISERGTKLAAEIENFFKSVGQRQSSGSAGSALPAK